MEVRHLAALLQVSGEDLYDSTHGAKVLRLAPGLKKLKFVAFRPAAYDTAAEKMAFFDPALEADFLAISGEEWQPASVISSKMREFARKVRTMTLPSCACHCLGHTIIIGSSMTLS